MNIRCPSQGGIALLRRLREKNVGYVERGELPT